MLEKWEIFCKLVGFYLSIEVVLKIVFSQGKSVKDFGENKLQISFKQT